MFLEIMIDLLSKRIYFVREIKEEKQKISRPWLGLTNISSSGLEAISEATRLMLDRSPHTDDWSKSEDNMTLSS